MTNITLSALESLYNGERLSFAQSQTVFDEIMQGKVDEISLTALLIALKIKGEHIDEIAGAASAMINNAKAFPKPDYAFSDIVGTGGDGHNTINVSSAAAIVAAACGVKVAKHGNRSVSSKSGSSDLFAGFGMDLMMSPQTARRCLDEANICFLAAPNYHSGVAHAMGVRTTLKTRTIFNVLGPLANPAQPSHGIYGVYTPDLLDAYAQVLVKLGHKHALVVHGSGLDELALHGPSEARHIQDSIVSSITITPESFGATPSPIKAIEGGEPAHNVDLIAEVLSGKGQTAHQQAIALNASALLWVNAPQRKQTECFEQVMDTLLAGTPIRTIQAAAKLSKQEV